MENNKLKYVYEDPRNIEAWTDVNIYFKIAEEGSHLMYNLGFTPNQVTFLSLLVQLVSCYLLYKGRTKLAAFLYLLGYIFDSIDGRLARNYNMYSRFGEQFDMISDVFANFALILTMLYVYKKCVNLVLIPFILISLYLISSWQGHVEALNNYRKFNNDDFLKTKQEKFDDDSLINVIYLFLVWITYFQYKKEIGKFNEKNICDDLQILKYFGPGNFCTAIFIIMFMLPVASK